MKYRFFLPLSAIFVLLILQIAVSKSIIPQGLELLQVFNSQFGGYFYLFIFLIILLESIVYVGFYFPGQFFAVLLVIGANPEPIGIVFLTIAMVCAATIGSMINFFIGRQQAQGVQQTQVRFRALLLAMIHINSLAFFMVSQGANGQRWRIVWLAGLLNLPYYLVLIWGTTFFSESIMQMAENTYFIMVALVTWLLIAIFLDVKQYRAAKI